MTKQTASSVAIKKRKREEEEEEEERKLPEKKVQKTSSGVQEIIYQSKKREGKNRMSDDNVPILNKKLDLKRSLRAGHSKYIYKLFDLFENCSNAGMKFLITREEKNCPFTVSNLSMFRKFMEHPRNDNVSLEKDGFWVTVEVPDLTDPSNSMITQTLKKRTDDERKSKKKSKLKKQKKKAALERRRAMSNQMNQWETAMLNESQRHYNFLDDEDSDDSGSQAEESDGEGEKKDNNSPVIIIPKFKVYKKQKIKVKGLTKLTKKRFYPDLGYFMEESSKRRQEEDKLRKRIEAEESEEIEQLQDKDRYSKVPSLSEKMGFSSHAIDKHGRVERVKHIKGPGGTVQKIKVAERRDDLNSSSRKSLYVTTNGVGKDLGSFVHAQVARIIDWTNNSQMALTAYLDHYPGEDIDPCTLYCLAEMMRFKFYPAKAEVFIYDEFLNYATAIDIVGIRYDPKRPEKLGKLTLVEMKTGYGNLNFARPLKTDPKMQNEMRSVRYTPRNVSSLQVIIPRTSLMQRYGVDADGLVLHIKTLLKRAKFYRCQKWVNTEKNRIRLNKGIGKITFKGTHKQRLLGGMKVDKLPRLETNYNIDLNTDSDEEEEEKEEEDIENDFGNGMDDEEEDENLFYEDVI